ncbi:MAG TPA: adenosine deaminase [Candidatus Limnocylindria bacterium]|nr:adenosine deaminase [Candidatus Limnocylindria bacterium]
MDDAAYFRALPKAELHLHLDGSVRPATVLDLATADGVPVPTTDLKRLRAHLEATEETPSLTAYIAYFQLPIAIMQTVPALERVTYELCQDLAADGVRYAEIRYAPWLHVNRGLSLTDVIRATLNGLRAGQAETGLAGGLIITALRTMPPDQNVTLAQAAGGFVGEGVVGFDLAGDEAGHPPGTHEDAFRAARSLGLNLTIHAGEGAGPESVRQAIALGAMRIGHGVRARQDPEVVEMARENGVEFDTAPTSNVQTKAVPRLEDHPLLAYFRTGIRVTISTDSRTVSRTTLTNEYLKVATVLGGSRADIWAMNLQALDGAFAEPALKSRLRREFSEAEARLAASKKARRQSSGNSATGRGE